MPVAASPIIDLETDVKPFLGITKPDFDAILTTFAATASQMIVTRVGQVAGSPTVDEWHDGGSPRIVLRNQGPIQSVTTVTESYGGSVVYTLTEVVVDQPNVNAYGFSVALDEGLLVRRASGIAVPFAPGLQNVHVTYVAGWSTTPADIKHACLLRVMLLWETSQRGSGVRGTTGTAAAPELVEAQINELLSAYEVPGIA